MGFSVSIPQVGQPHSTEDVKVGNALTTIQTWGNGNIAGSDLSASAAIARSQLAGGFGNLTLTQISGNTSAVDGAFYNLGGANATITLPSAGVNRTVGVRCGGANTFAATVVPSGGAKIFGLGIVSPWSSVPLAPDGAFAVFQSDGSNWVIVAGQQDTGWVAVTLGGGATATTEGALVRQQGDTVRLKGSYNAPTNSATITLPAGLRPPATIGQVPVSNSGGFDRISISTAGVVNAASAGTVFLYGVTFATT